jgi:O-6-methylguanine DNA methyltransferase
MIEIYIQNSDGTWFAIATSKQQIIATSFGIDQNTTVEKVLFNIPFNLAFQVFHEPMASVKNALATLKGVYEGKDVNGNLSLATSHLPAYTKKVLKTTSKAVGGGPRAVGNIMASNPFAPIIPCHRVVKADFTLGGYGFGLKVKAELLCREKRGFSSSKEIEVDDDEQLMVFPVENVLRNFA